MPSRETLNEKLLVFRKKINQVRKKFHDTVTDFKFVERSMMIVLVGYLGLLLIAVIVAYMFGGTRQGPGTYRIWTNWISDLGSGGFTPAPYLYDIACGIAGVMTIPFVFYMEKLLTPMPQKPEDYNKITRLRQRLGSYAFIFGIIGSITYIGVGIWSGDRATMIVAGTALPMHGIMSVLAFLGFTMGAFFLGWIIVLYDCGIPKGLGIYGIIGPFTTIILNGIFGGPFLEWMLLFSILIWIIPLSLILMSNEELQLHRQR